MFLLEYLKAIFLGLVEGITEWLPISSTGHMILFDEFVKLDITDNFKELFFVVIQLGAIVAVPVLFWDTLFPFSKSKTPAERRKTLSIWLKVIVGAVPAAIFGFLLDDFLNEYLYNYVVVAIALIVYGIAFIVVEKLNSNNADRILTVDDLGYIDALKIGTFQILSLIPGTSRSGSTILGGRLIGVSRKASAEFSFFMAIPIMIGASGLKLLKYFINGNVPSPNEIGILIVGMIVSFVVSLAIIKFLMDFVKRHDFSSFGIYRIILGALVIGYFTVKTFF